MSVQLKGNDNSSFSDDVEIGSGNIALNADGSADFADNVTIGESPNSSTESGVLIGTGGSVLINRIDDGANAAFSVREKGTENARVNSDGTASLVGGIVNINSNGKIGVGNYGTPAGREGCTISALEVSTFKQTLYTGTSGSAADNHIRCYAAGSDSGTKSMVFQVNNGGKIRATNTTIGAVASERRLKTNIQLVDPIVSWQTIRDLPYYEYNWKEYPGDPEKIYGPIADEVPDEMRIATDRTDDAGVIHTYDNGMLQARLYTALQTALTRIEALEAKVQTLEGGAS